MNQLKLEKNHKYLLACSYGPDSMALFYLLKSQGYDFDCAIVNYHLRKESDSEVKGLLDFAKANNIKVHVLDVDHIIDRNVEGVCRYIRYNYFYELTKKIGYYATLVAHHQDDLIETYLLQKNRQNCPIYYGIKENTVINRVNIIRPLLAYSKKDLLDICEQNHIPYSIDSTNYDLSIKRNEIRHNLVEKMSKEEREKIIKEIDEQNAKLAKLQKTLNEIDLESVETMISLDEKTQRYALNKLIELVDENTKLSKENVGQVIYILKSPKPNGKFHIKKDIYLYKEYDHFCLVNERAQAVRKPYSIVVKKPMKIDNEYFYLDFTKDTTNRNVFPSDYPLTIRPIRKDDEYYIGKYEVEARRLLIDWKVPYRLRVIWPVILNKNNKVIYIPRYRKDFVPDENCNFYIKVK